MADHQQAGGSWATGKPCTGAKLHFAALLQELLADGFKAGDFALDGGDWCGLISHRPERVAADAEELKSWAQMAFPELEIALNISNEEPEESSACRVHLTVARRRAAARGRAPPHPQPQVGGGRTESDTPVPPTAWRG